MKKNFFSGKKEQDMTRLVSITPAPPSTVYKWLATFSTDNGRFLKKTYFGHREYQDYTIHKDKERRRLYRLRHSKDLRTRDPTRAGFLSYFLLWGPSTQMKRNISLYKKQFHL